MNTYITGGIMNTNLVSDFNFCKKAIRSALAGLVGITFLISAPTLGMAAISDTSGKMVEVPLEALLAPSRGYDNTNNIEVVLHGYLPNTCYRLADYQAVKEGD